MVTCCASAYSDPSRSKPSQVDAVSGDRVKRTLARFARQSNEFTDRQRVAEILWPRGRPDSTLNSLERGSSSLRTAIAALGLGPSRHEAQRRFMGELGTTPREEPEVSVSIEQIPAGSALDDQLRREQTQALLDLLASHQDTLATKRPRTDHAGSQ